MPIAPSRATMLPSTCTSCFECLFSLCKTPNRKDRDGFPSRESCFGRRVEAGRNQPARRKVNEEDGVRAVAAARRRLQKVEKVFQLAEKVSRMHQSALIRRVDSALSLRWLTRWVPVELRTQKTTQKRIQRLTLRGQCGKRDAHAR